METLPIDGHVPQIVDAVRRQRSLVVVAPPGAGKTTRVPPALAEDGAVIVLQPRRIAARALARRIADERGWQAGREVGWQVRFERRFSSETRLLVATEGILTARLQQDPLLGGFSTVVLDEFHERSLHADLALALVRQAALARDDLRIVVMSATLDAAPVAQFLGDCPVIEVPGRTHPIDVRHRADLSPADAVRDVLGEPGGHALVFLPGAPEIRRVERDLASLARDDARILPLHGSLDATAQDAALAPSERRKIILCTNLAETSLTVDGVTHVIDTGLHKVLRRDPCTGIDRLEAERISLDSAEQRAGRAGRTGPGTVLRLWDPREAFRRHREPELRRVDLAAPFLDLLTWGADPAEFEWFEAPPAESAREALVLLRGLGAMRDGRVTQLGRALCRLPLHPRLARLLHDCGGSPASAALCAALSEGWRPAGPFDTTDSDALVIAERIGEAPQRVRRAARELERLARGGAGPTAMHSLRRAVLAAYPERVARRREAGARRLVLSSGHGAELDADSGVRHLEYLVALDVVAGARGRVSEARVRLASGVDAEWLEVTSSDVCHELDRSSGRVRAFESRMHRSLVLSRREVPPDPENAAAFVAQAVIERGPGGATAAVLRRTRFAGLELDYDGLVRQQSVGRTALFEPDVEAGLTFGERSRLERLAPETIPVPSGRNARLEYRDDGSVVAAVKLQELFGLADSPTLGPDRRPVVFSLLAPNGRPVQTTRDLRSFWERTYPEVRKELRGRYAKHPWPEDPWNAPATHRAKPRKK
ncbi:MAG: ATP-dependent helicase HrpB [bacterium]|nr:ATP-dependent helicase HrpB [bacterium]